MLQKWKKILCFCGAPFCRAPVRPNMLNMSKSASDLNAVVEYMHLEVENSHSLDIHLCHLFCFKNSNLKDNYTL